MPQSRRNAQGGELKYEYDGARRLSALFNENNTRYDCTYDALDRLIEETGFDARHTRYRYDPSGLIQAKLEAGCMTAQERLDARLAREAASTQRAHHPYVPAQRSAPTFEDPWGLGLVDESAPLTAPPGHQILTRYQRDPAGRPIQKQVAGHVLSGENKPQPQHKATRFGYDDAGRLIEASNDAGARTELGYDALGQLIEGTRTVTSRIPAIPYASNRRFPTDTLT